jgi:hypothetical protein
MSRGWTTRAAATRTPAALWLLCASWHRLLGALVRVNLYFTRAYFYFSDELDPNTGPASYDLTDTTRQLLCNIFQDVHDVFVSRSAQNHTKSLMQRLLTVAYLFLRGDVGAVSEAGGWAGHSI